MTHVPEKQLQAEPAVEKAIVKTPEILSSPHDILGKEYDFNGVSFTVLGMDPEFFDGDETTEDLQPGTVAIVNIQKQRIPAIPFQGGMARITKIQIGDEVIVGSADILKRIIQEEQVPEGWMTNNGIADECDATNVSCSIIADKYRAFHLEWFHLYIKNGRYFEHYAPELCEIIRNELSQQEDAPEGWMTKNELVKKINVGEPLIRKYSDVYRQSHPEWIKNYRIRDGKIYEHYSPELSAIIRNELSQREDAPQGWMTNRSLANELRVVRETIVVRVKRYRQSNPEWFHKYKNIFGKIYEHYAPELCGIIRKEITKRKKAPNEWKTNANFAIELGETRSIVKKYAEYYRQSHPEWFCDYFVNNGGLYEHYSPQLCDTIQNDLSNKERVPDGWMTKNKLMIQLGVSQYSIRNLTHSYRQSHSEWFQDYRVYGSSVYEYFSPELCEIIRGEIDKLERAPDGWMTKNELVIKLNIGERLIRKYLDAYSQTHPEWFHEYRDKGGRWFEHFSQELCDIIRGEIGKIEHAPKGWMTNKGLAEELHIRGSAINRRANLYASSHPEWFHWYKPNRGKLAEYYSPELCDLIRQAVKDKRS